MNTLLKIKFALLAALCISAMRVEAQDFNEFFSDTTLRVDYLMTGNRDTKMISVDEMVKIPHWYGKRRRLTEVPSRGYGEFVMRDDATGQVIYRNTFNTLFHEWLATDESKHTTKSFQNCMLMPMPKRPATVTVTLYDYHQEVMVTTTHPVKPGDILIRLAGVDDVQPYKTIQAAKDPNHCIHIAYLAEGYTKDQMDKYIADVNRANEAMFRHEPFKSMRDRFNIVAVMSESVDSGASVPREGKWLNTALQSHFDTFYMDRYLSTLHLKRVHDLLAGAPYEHIIILVNTSTYGGGGVYNNYNLSYTGGRWFEPVVVHEFGHSFANLADEYAYGDSDPMYFPDKEPFEPNITTLCDFSSKWQDMVEKGTLVPTPLTIVDAKEGSKKRAKQEAEILTKVGAYEGAGYLTHGTYRPCQDCRMRTNQVPEFCPVCQRAIRNLIDFYTK